jgi:FixJ family two-component response regulator
MTGLDLYEKLVSMGARYQVIFITGHDNPQWKARAEKAGAVAYLKKPFRDYSLLDAIALTCCKGRNGS